MAYQNQFIDTFIRALLRLRILLEWQLIIDNRLLFYPGFYRLYLYFPRILKITIYGRSHFLRRISVKGLSWVYQRHCQCSLEQC